MDATCDFAAIFLKDTKIEDINSPISAASALIVFLKFVSAVFKRLNTLRSFAPF